MAIEMYANDNGGKYPSTNGVWYSACSTLGTQTTQNGAIPGLVPNYIKQLPLDSQTDGGSLCCYAYDSPIGGADYKYMFYNCPSSLACYGSTEAGSGLGDPNRSTSACAVYTTNAQGL